LHSASIHSNGGYPYGSTSRGVEAAETVAMTGTDGVGVVNVRVGFVEGNERSFDDVASHEVVNGCEGPGDANRAVDGTYCN
jgi:hypothetical protein